MAQSLKLSPFTSLGTPNNVLSDDYVHGTFETYKIKGSTANGSKFDYKVKVNAVNKDGKLQATIVDEGKIQFPVKNGLTVQLAQRRKGDLRAHVDLGQFTFSGKSWNLFSNVKSDTNLSKFNLRVGTNYFGPVCESNTRLELVPGEAPVATHRNYVTKGNNYYGFVASLNLSTLALLRYDALIGYQNSKYELNLKHESTQKAKQIEVGTLTLTGNYQHDATTKVAAEVQNKGIAVNPTVTVGAQKKLTNGAIVKGKLNNKLQLSLATKYAINSQFTVTGALQLAFKEEKLVDLSKFPPIPLGLQLDINV